MNKRSIIICFIAVLLFSCEKKDWDIVEQSQAAIPVTVSNSIGLYTAVPTVETSLAGGGAISITLTIPASSGKKIKEITRVGLGSVNNNYKVVQTTTGLYNSAPIAGNGTSVTFTTTLAEYSSKTGISVTTGGTATSFLTRYFYFMITLDDGQQIIPVPVRVYVNS
jgi:hypothetical protein